MQVKAAMSKSIDIVKRVKKFLTPEIFFLFLLLIAAFILRVYRVGQILNFYYDQGRDALVIWDLIHSHKFFLIGPTTGLAGIFRGPYYYYLITPFYFLGKGSPIWPSVFLAFTAVFAIWLLYVLGKKIQGLATGFLAVVIATFSFYIIFASRWLSNPTPMLLLSVVLVWAMFEVTEGKRWAWPIIALVSGLSLFNFGSSGEFFYFPALFVFLIWQWKGRPDVKNLVWSIILFSLTFAPLVMFDLKHDHILLHNLFGTFGVGSGSFVMPSIKFILQRTLAYYDIFSSKIFVSMNNYDTVALIIVALYFLASLPKLLKNKKVKIVLLLLISPIVGLYFYRGNYGVLYDYYMTGYYLIFVLLFAIVLGRIWQNRLGKLFIGVFLILFLLANFPLTLAKENDGCDGPLTICLSNQTKAIDWIYKDAGSSNFNVDEYVPPVIPYAYNYLFLWLGTEKYHKLPVDSQIPLLYTLYEVDPDHPERLNAWLDRQKRIAKPLYQEKETTGGITVQRRTRI